MSAATRQALYDRLVELLGKHDVHPEDRAEIQAAAGAESWDDVPADTRAKIEQLERDLPAQSWDDPLDMPADVND